VRRSKCESRTSEVRNGDLDLNIRPATSSDVPALIALERDIAEAAHWTAEQYRDVFNNSVPRRMILIVEQEACVQGFLAARSIDAEWEIENLGVASNLRRHGTGTALTREFLRVARADGGTTVLLEVRESNTAAREFYLKLGFVQDGRRKAYYRNPNEDAINYRLRFS
jgi:[ribosomal protein S18]-alanine N-acetyltransferase